MKPIKLLITPIVFFCMIITACSAELPKYDLKQAIANGDVADVHEQTTNLSKLDDFINKVHNIEKDKVTVTIYTNEGDPIIQTLNYTGKTIEYNVDTRRDKFSGESDRVIKKYEFTNIAKESNNNMTVYFLSNNDKTSRMDVLTVSTASKN